MKKLFLLFLLAVASMPLQAQWQTEWRTMTDDGTSGENFNRMIRLDNQGRIYCGGRNVASGKIRSDIMLVKYDTLGNELWTHVFSRSGDRNETLQDMTVDHNNNVILTGEGFNTSNVSDVLVVKYGSSGVLMWSDSINGSSSLYDRGTAVCVDDSNNIYVTGYIYNSSFKGFLAKYNPAGQLQYLNIIPTLQQGHGIHFSNGHILLYGITGSAGSNHHTQFLKFSRDGVLLHDYLISDSNDNRIMAFAETPDHYFIVDTRSASSTGPYDYAVYCLDTAMAFVWKSVQSAGTYLSPASMSLHDSTVYITGIETVNTMQYQAQIDVRALNMLDGSVKHQLTYTSGSNYFTQYAEHISDSYGNLSLGYYTNGNATGNGEYKLLRFDKTLQFQSLTTLPDSMSYGEVHLAQPNNNVIYYGTDIVRPASAQRDFLLYKLSDIVQSVVEHETNTYVVYPNPTSDRVYIQTKGNQSFSWKLSDACGKLLEEGLSNTHESLSLKPYKNGIYFLNLRADQQQMTYKLVKL